MNGDLLKLVIGVAIGTHGIGHVLGWMPAWGIAKFEGMSSRSWILTEMLGDGASRALGGALWLAPTIGFVIAAAGLLTGQSWWRPIAAGSGVVSLAAVALFWDALPTSSRAGCIAVDLAVVVGLLAAHLPSASIVGS